MIIEEYNKPSSARTVVISESLGINTFYWLLYFRNTIFLQIINTPLLGTTNFVKVWSLQGHFLEFFSRRKIQFLRHLLCL